MVTARRHIAAGACRVLLALSAGCALHAPPAEAPHGAPGDESAVVYTMATEDMLTRTRPEPAEEPELALAALCAGPAARPRASRRPGNETRAGGYDVAWPAAAAPKMPEPAVAREPAAPSAETIARQASTAPSPSPAPFDKISVVPMIAAQRPESPLPTNLYLRDPGWGAPSFGQSYW